MPDSILTLDPSDRSLQKITKGCKPGDVIHLEGTFTVGQDMSLKLDSVEDYQKDASSEPMDESEESPKEEAKETPKEEAAENESENANPDKPQGQEIEDENQGTKSLAGGMTPGGKPKTHYAPALIMAIHTAHAMPKKAA